MSTLSEFFDGKILSGGSLVPTDFNLATTLKMEQISPSYEREISYLDQIRWESSSGIYVSNYDYVVNKQIHLYDTPLQLISLSPNISTPSTEKLLYRNNGSCIYRISSSDNRISDLELPFYYEHTITSSFLSYNKNTFISASIYAIDSRIATKDSGSIPLYITQDFVNLNFVRNPNFWGSDIDLTCVSNWNNNVFGLEKMAGVAVTPRHVLLTAHFPIEVGNIISFVTSDNLTVTRSVVDVQNHPYFIPPFLGVDIRVLRLDSDLPPSIKPAKLFNNHLNWIPSYNTVAPVQVPVLIIDKREFGVIHELVTYGSASITLGFPEVNSHRREFIKEGGFIIGDSGSPTFLITEDGLVLIMMLTFGFAGSGTTISTYLEGIQDIINGWGDTSYNLNIYNSNKYKNFT